MSGITAQLAPYRNLVANRNYRSWFLSSLASSFGDWIGLFALQVLVVRLAPPGSRLALFGLSAVMAARLLPSLVFGPIAGVIADRYSRRRLMVGADVGRAALFTAIAFSRSLVLLLALVFLVECLSLVYLSAKNAVLPHIVERRDLAHANQLTQLVTYGPLPFGAAVDGLLSWLGGRWGLENPTVVALVFTGLLFLMAGAVLLRMQLADDGRGDDAGAGDQRAMRQLREGVAAVWDRPLIRSLLLGLLGVFFGAGVIVAVGPEFVRSDLGRSEADWYGLMSTVGFGLLAGIVAAPALLSRGGPAWTLPVALVGAAAGAVVTALLPSFRLVQVSGFALGGFAGFAFVAGFTLLHERTHEQSRARVFAAVYTGTRIAMFAALALGPLLAGVIGAPSLTVGGRTLTASGIRMVMLLGAVVALGGAGTAALGVRRSLRADDGNAGQGGRRGFPHGEQLGN